MGKNVHVVRSGNKWVVKHEKQPTPVSTHRTQGTAIKAATPIARRAKSDVVIHGRDNAIRDRDSYGRDPHPPRDKKH